VQVPALVGGALPGRELTDVTAKVVIYFKPKYEDFRSCTIWSLSNAFTSAFKELDPIQHFRATAKLEFLEARFSTSFTEKSI